MGDRAGREPRIHGGGAGFFTEERVNFVEARIGPGDAAGLRPIDGGDDLVSGFAHRIGAGPVVGIGRAGGYDGQGQKHPPQPFADFT